MAKEISAYQVLRNKFPANECVLIEEVSDASGFARSRSLDFMIINLWQSRGLSVTGVERKSFRSDWLKELRQPEKQENHFKYCDYFYLLTDKEGIAKLEEIPETWGWYHINEKGILKTLKAAPKLTPLPIGKSLMCAMMRRAADKGKYVHIDTIEQRIEEARLRGLNEASSGRDYILQEAEKWKKIADEFKESTGLELGYRWGAIEPKKFGAAVKLIEAGEIEKIEKQLHDLKTKASLVMDRVNKAFNELINE